MLSATALLCEVISKLTLSPKYETEDDVTGKRKIVPPELKHDQVLPKAGKVEPLMWTRDEEGEIVLLSDPSIEIVTICNN